jgi:hypothetical protein
MTVVFWVWHYGDLRAHTDISEVHTAFIFRVEVCWFGNRVSYMVKLNGRLFFESTERRQRKETRSEAIRRDGQIANCFIGTDVE